MTAPGFPILARTISDDLSAGADAIVGKDSESIEINGNGLPLCLVCLPTMNFQVILAFSLPSSARTGRSNLLS